VHDYGNRQAIATSTGQNDSGLFELLFRDERYLPFEHAGAVSTWKLEIPPENNEFDLDSLADVVLHLNYTARDGGPVLRAAATAAARSHIPDAGVRLIDVSREMPDEWARFTRERDYRRLEVRALELFLGSDAAHPSTHVDVEFDPDEQSCRDPDIEYPFLLVGGANWCGYYHGCVDVEVDPVTTVKPKRIGTLEFEHPVTDATEAYLLVHYRLRGGHADGGW
jgi:hypothetical protein